MVWVSSRLVNAMSHRKGKTEKKFLKSAFLKIKGSIMAQIDPTDEPRSFQISMSHNVHYES